MEASPPPSDEEISPPKNINNPLELNLGAAGALLLGENELRLSQDSGTAPGTARIVEETQDPGCCGLGRKGHGQLPNTILYYDILWAELRDFVLTISYAQRIRKTATLHTLVISIPAASVSEASEFIERLIDRAYNSSSFKSQPRKRIKVLINPHGGRGRAAKIYSKHIEPFFKAAACQIEVEHTTHHKHGEEIAQRLNIEDFDVVACCSGDGLPHEVFNGLAKQKYPRRALRKLAVCQLPCGSGNGMSWNLNGTDDPALAALTVVKGVRMPMDLVSVTQGNTRTLSFLSQAVGIIAECDLGTEDLRWMGDTRFTIGYVKRLMTKTIWPVDVAIGTAISETNEIKRAYHHVHSEISKRPDTIPDVSLTLLSEDDSANDLPTLRFGSINDALPDTWLMKPYPNLGNFYAGNMAYMTANSNVFPTSLPADGLMDLICVNGDISRRRAMQLADATGSGALIDSADVKYQKIVGYRIVPRQKDGYISIDGERIPFGGFQAEVHHGLGTVLGKVGGIYMAKGPSSVE
ncbi:sphingosine kinase [Microthyrium microscopicum]|uniref:Sphingosine kinase n=1 Tax=Microthyrium microscopicum TaxID=703497 RepID=A0A6A6U872_9PEZI|nr:sphingosine kinase [Microthyrium microscopicum]